MRNLIICLSLVLVLIPSLVISQSNKELGYIKGEMLVQLKQSTDLNKILIDHKDIDLTMKHLVSERFNIYLLEFDYSLSKNINSINSLRSNPQVINAQNNHFVSERVVEDNIPNDEYFEDQWSFMNTGQSGGLLDADIDATDAWEITTGGISADGDTIVIAIIDSGSDIDHDDLNFWKNNDEIPDNDIDDDNNGFIDDYDGWNSLAHNGNITTGSHGTHVTGIAAAIGNNELGVAGVSWGVKVLPVIGSSTVESIVVEALSYVYTIRETYDLSGGSAGAFIIADNCSFGVDNGQPEDYPIWEAMYDSLGQLGIVSVGATANRNWNIDETGDIPCAFTTDYLISVTNTTNLDQLFSIAAWGDTAIDMGAPGTQIKSLYPNNNVGNKTGTSMAAPHVTGSIALLFSAANEDFVSAYKANPAEGSLILKQHILDGVDLLETLEGKTVTGGRLNIFNSINNLINAPILDLEEDSIYYEMLTESVEDGDFLISNVGIDTLFYTISLSNTPQWLNLENYSGNIPGGESFELNYNINNSGLDTGYYETSININGSNYFGKELIMAIHIDGFLNIEINNYIVDVQTFPNPFNNKVNFRINEVGTVELEVYDQFGKLVFHKESNIDNSNNLIVWDSNLTDGIYYYRIKSDFGMANGKLIQVSY